MSPGPVGSPSSPSPASAEVSPLIPRVPGVGPSAPPIRRASMVATPWRGFWRGLFDGMAGVFAGGDLEAEAKEPWEVAAKWRRRVLLVLVALSAVGATALLTQVLPVYEANWLRVGQITLFSLLFAWVSAGFFTALMGFWVQLRGDPHALRYQDVLDDTLSPDARTAIIMPICNEQVATVFAGLRATLESVAAAGGSRLFDLYVLSDTSDPTLRAAELAAWAELRTTLGGNGRVYYRWRQHRTKRKSGNVADFCRRWGKDYRYMVVLDADSVMTGDALVTMVKLMEAHPKAGIIQTAPQACGLSTVHARAQQFAGRVAGRLFTAGMQYWQLGESHYWGHNAILRVEPFMRHCALAPIPGRGGLCGPILSHDFVEAALMRRAGYHVWLVGDLTGSYEQQPPDLLSELQRDRRWCQGNLQNARLIAEPGLHRVHRAMFAVGAMSYLSAPLWLVFLCLGTALWVSGAGLAPHWQAVPVELRFLWAWTLAMLFLPRLLGVAAVFLRREQAGFGGAPALLRSALLETVLALLQAPVRMLAHSLFVLVALTGLKLEWKSPPRSANGVSWCEAAVRLAPTTLLVALQAALVAAVRPDALLSLLPVAVPLLLAVPLTVLTSHVVLGDWLRARAALLIPEEARSPAVLRRAWDVYAGRAPEGLTGTAA